jgi:hypothetical protein
MLANEVLVQTDNDSCSVDIEMGSEGLAEGDVGAYPFLVPRYRVEGVHRRLRESLEEAAQHIDPRG